MKLYNEGSTLVAVVKGELDDNNAANIREELDKAIMQSTVRNLVFDFSELDFMDSSGIGVIIGRYKNIQNVNGMVAIAALTPQVEKIIKMCGIEKIIKTYDTVTEAIESMSNAIDKKGV